MNKETQAPNGYRQGEEPNFKEKATTEIWDEEASLQNSYIAEKCYLYGYDIMALTKHRSFVDVLFLIFRAELPSPTQAQLLEALMIACINPGPRHPATRATMNAGVSKANYEHILPIGLTVLGGSFQGSSEVEKAMYFLSQNSTNKPNKVAQELLNNQRPEQGDWHIAPGFGSYYGSINIQASKLANHLLQLSGVGQNLKWGQHLAERLEQEQLSWLTTGVVAAVLADLGFGAREGAGLFQIMAAPGLLAHGLEQSHKPINAMPLLEDENYVVQPKK